MYIQWNGCSSQDSGVAVITVLRCMCSHVGVNTVIFDKDTVSQVRPAVIEFK